MNADDEYLEALMDKLASQRSAQISGSSAVRDLIGGPAVRRWGACVWPVRCQTCGDPLVTKAALSADRAGEDTVLLSLHHSVCRPSDVRRASGKMRAPTTAMAASILPSLDGTEALPVMVVNPSCEQLVLARVPGGWRNATLDDFTRLGFASPERALPTAHGIGVRLDGARLTVAATADLPRQHRWDFNPGDALRTQIRRDRAIAIAVTNKIVPGRRTSTEQVRRAFSDPGSLTAWVPLVQHEPPSSR